MQAGFHMVASRWVLGYNSTMSRDPRHSFGTNSEQSASDYLENSGYRILARNVSSKLGEIDIIAMDGETLVFIEVRSRTRSDQVHPAATVTRKKQLQIIRCATAWCQKHRIRDTMIRFDVVAVLGPKGKIELYQNAFEANR